MTPNDKPFPGANAALAWLIVINLFNYIDRQVLSAVLPLLEMDGTLFAPNDENIKFKLGLLTSAFLAAYMVFAPIVGWLDGHGYRRWVILGLGVSVWSIASGSSGFAASYAVLFATRCLVGVGEGAYGPVSSAMLADIYPPRLRGMVMALFNMAVPVGSALGFVIGGEVANAFGDWRHAFWITYFGLFLGAVLLFKTEFPRPGLTGVARQAYGDVLKGLARNRSFVLCCAGMTAITFVIGGVAAWVPTYIFQREARFVVNDDVIADLSNPPAEEGRKSVPAEVANKLAPLSEKGPLDYASVKRHLVIILTDSENNLYAETIFKGTTAYSSIRLSTITTTFGGILVLGGLGATAAGGWLGEKYRTRIRGGYFWVIGLGALFALPCYVALLYAPFPLAWLFIFLTIFGLFFHIGPGFTILANVVTPEVRATAFAVNILVIHALGDVISPPLIGFVADRSDLHTAFLLMSVVILLGAGLWIYAARFLEADTAAAERNG